MGHFLTRVRAGVRDDAISGVDNALLLGDALDDLQHVLPQRPVRFPQLVEGLVVRPGYHQHVRRRDRRNVVEGDNIGGFLKECRPELASSDPAEDAIVVPIRHRVPLLAYHESAPATEGAVPESIIGASMPELPEVETVRQVARSLVLGCTIERVRVSDTFPAVLEGDDGIDPPSTLIGRRIQEIHRRGKYLLVELDGNVWVIVHLRMTGRLLVTSRTAPPIRFEHLALELDSGQDIRFGDQRKFGRVSVVRRETVDALHDRLGVEPLSRRFTGAWLHDRLANRPGKIKAVLLDQHLIAGLGNIYVDEALFRSRINPLTPAKSLTLAHCARLARAIRQVLRLSLSNQGTTFSTFENPYGEAGSNAQFLQVYGKGRRHEPCPRCGAPLDFGVVGGRGHDMVRSLPAAPFGWGAVRRCLDGDAIHDGRNVVG